jgi:hypothetical protein
LTGLSINTDGKIPLLLHVESFQVIFLKKDVSSEARNKKCIEFNVLSLFLSMSLQFYLGPNPPVLH